MLNMERIGFRYRQGGPQPSEYLITLQYAGRKLDINWHSPRRRPQLRRIMGVILLDNALVQLPYADWCVESNLALDEASKGMYETQQRVWQSMLALFGDDYYKLRESYADA